MNSNESITILKISPTLGTLADSYDGDKLLFGKEGKYKGWDAADAIESGFKTSDIESLIEGQSFFSMTELDDILGVADGAVNGKPADLSGLKKILEELLEQAATDCGIPYGKEFLVAFAELKAKDYQEYVRYRHSLSKIKGVKLSEIEERMGLEADALSSPESIVDCLISSIKKTCKFFCNKNKEAFIQIPRGTVVETMRVESKEFNNWLSHKTYTDFKAPLADPDKKLIRSTIAGIAQFDKSSETKEAFYRCAKIDGAYYIDRGTDDRSAVKITSDGWEIVSNPPVPFVRVESTGLLPTPDTDGDFDLIWGHLNVQDKDRMLILAYLIESMRPETPYPVLEIIGEQGSAKSTTQERLKRLIDPAEVDLKLRPESLKDLYAGTSNCHIQSFNNISNLSPKMQDALCCASTGGGVSARTLYTNLEETSLDVKRPVMLNGISPVVTAQDLVDRTITLILPTIGKFKDEILLSKLFESDKPKILGGLFDIFARALDCLDKVEIDKPPRMADFARLGEAVAMSSGYESGIFMASYEANRLSAIQMALEASPVALALLSFMENKDTYSNSLQKLMNTLDVYRKDSDGWPKSAKGLSESLRRSAAALRSVGLDIYHNPVRKSDGYHVAIKWNGNEHNVLDEH